MIEQLEHFLGPGGTIGFASLRVPPERYPLPLQNGAIGHALVARHPLGAEQTFQIDRTDRHVLEIDGLGKSCHAIDQAVQLVSIGFLVRREATNTLGNEARVPAGRRWISSLKRPPSANSAVQAVKLTDALAYDQQYASRVARQMAA